MRSGLWPALWRMTESRVRKRVLIVGAGRRVQNNFLPAFACLTDLFEVCGIHSRTLSRLTEVAGRWGVPAVGDLSSFDLAGVDLVAISVPTSQNDVVLRKLLPRSKNLRIIIDTPISWTPAERVRTEAVLENFPFVTVAEDYMNFPNFSLLRDVVVQGIIGRPSSLALFNIGYLYHGLALIRSFVGFAPVVRKWHRPLGSYGSVVGYEFDDGFVATVIGPYRRDSGSGLVLEGTRGLITESPSDLQFASSQRSVHALVPVRSDGRLLGYRITGDGPHLSVDLPDFGAMREMDFQDKSDLNLLRGCGLITVIKSIFHDQNINGQYGYKNALYDSFVSQSADRGDPLPDFCRALVAERPRSQLRWVAREATFLKTRIELAAMLRDGEKIGVMSGDYVVAERAEQQGDHVVLTSPTLNGVLMPGSGWLLYAKAWDRA
jgi:hypothetical protein